MFGEQKLLAQRSMVDDQPVLEHYLSLTLEDESASRTSLGIEKSEKTVFIPLACWGNPGHDDVSWL